MNSFNYQLTKGGIDLLRKASQNVNIILQVVQIRTVSPKSDNKPVRYMVSLSDGDQVLNTTLAQTLRPLLESNRIVTFTTIRVLNASVHNIKGKDIVNNIEKEVTKEVVIISNCEVLENPGFRITQNDSNRTNFQQNQNNINRNNQISSWNTMNSLGSGSGTMRNNSSFNNSFNQSTPMQTQNIDLSNEQIHPIRELDEYTSGWTIKARVSNKGDVRNWRKEEKSGRVASIDLVDNSGEIRVTMFSDEIDRFYGNLNVGDVYLIKGGKLKLSNPSFNHLNHKFEITLDHSSVIQKIENDSTLPLLNIDPVPISNLSECFDDASVDVVGVISNIYPEITGNSEKFNKAYIKRNVDLCDFSENSKRTVTLTIWGDKATNFSNEYSIGDIIAVTKCKKGSYNNVSLSTRFFSQIIKNPAIEQANSLRMWWNNGGSNLESVPMTQVVQKTSRTTKPRIPISMVLSNGPQNQTDEKFPTRILITNVGTDRDPWYDSCPGDNCRKGVTLGEDSLYHCPSCTGPFESCLKRYILKLRISDYSGHTFATAFDEIAQEILGISANDLASYKTDGDSSQYEAILNSIKFKEYLANIKVSPSSNQLFQNNISIQRIYPLDNRREAYSMVTQIDKYLSLLSNTSY